jgi:tRNA-specific 2-thiouridylase
MFVIQIIPETNTVVLGDEIELDKAHMFVSKMNYIKYDTIKDGQAAFSKIRYKSTAVSSTLFNENGAIKSVFDAPVKGIAPGQSAVFYEGDDVVAGGIKLLDRSSLHCLLLAKKKLFPTTIYNWVKSIFQ